MMFRLIGGAVVYGFALYGVAAFLDRPSVKVFLAQDKQGHDSPGNTPRAQEQASSAEPEPSPATDTR
jgi:hypothetical protein